MEEYLPLGLNLMVDFLAPKLGEGNFLTSWWPLTLHRNGLCLLGPERGFIWSPHTLPGQHAQDPPRNSCCPEFQDGTSRALNQELGPVDCSAGRPRKLLGSLWAYTPSLLTHSLQDPAQRPHCRHGPQLSTLWLCSSLLLP